MALFILSSLCNSQLHFDLTEEENHLSIKAIKFQQEFSKNFRIKDQELGLENHIGKYS